MNLRSRVYLEAQTRRVLFSTKRLTIAASLFFFFHYNWQFLRFNYSFLVARRNFLSRDHVLPELSHFISVLLFSSPVYFMSILIAHLIDIINQGSKVFNLDMHGNPVCYLTSVTKRRSQLSFLQGFELSFKTFNQNARKQVITCLDVILPPTKKTY